MAKELTEKEDRYCYLRVRYLNKSRAAHEAGYGKTRQLARFRAAELERRPEIQARIAEYQEEWREATGLTVERVLKELAAIAFSDIGKAASWNHSGVDLKSSDQIPARVRRAIKKVRHHFDENGGETVVEMHNKDGALEKLGRHLGMFKSTELEKISDSLAALIAQSMPEEKK